ncbi:MAG TPA: hypothetical protein VMW50_02940 [Dehalococcoidia bacterium]|nr:hypothetical protein [Dehalococcoidia bacterium]
MKKVEPPRNEVLLKIYDHESLDEEYENKTSIELLEIIDKAQLAKEGEKVDWKPVNKAENVLIYRLSGNLVTALNTDLREELIRIIARQNELIEAFRNHRHDKDKSYTEKPIW